MSLEVFAEATRLQQSYIETPFTTEHGIGKMELKRWNKNLYQQLQDLKLVQPGMNASEFFVQF